MCRDVVSVWPTVGRQYAACGDAASMCMHAVGEALARVHDAAGHRKRLQVVERVRDLLVDRALAVLELALDRERLLRVLGDAEDVDAAVLADDGLADA